MTEIIIKDGEKNHKFNSSLAYVDNRIVLTIHGINPLEEISDLIRNLFMQGDLFKDTFPCQLSNEIVSVNLKSSSIDSIVTKEGGRLYILQLNQAELTYPNKQMDECIIINLPPSEIKGLSTESKIIIEALGTDIVFGYNDENSTSVSCPKNMLIIVVSLISLYYCYPIEILEEYRYDSNNNQTVRTLRSQKRSLEKQSSRINLYAHANSVVEFLPLANASHPYFKDLPRYVRQFIDSNYVSEPQRYNMLFAMASSFAEYVLGEHSSDGEKLVRHTIRHFNLKAKQKKIEKTIKDSEFHRIKNGKDIEINNLAELRNESEHCLYSDKSYAFFDTNPSVNVFMNEISCRIVMELAGIKRDE